PQHGTARPKATAGYIPAGAFNATCAPMPMTPRVTPPTFCESYARCRPSMPNPTFAPITQPTLDVVLPPDGLRQRLLMDRYGSMLMPGVGTLTLTPAPPRNVVSLGTNVTVPVSTELVVLPPSWKFSATGMRLPPMTLNCAVPPTDVKLWLYPLGFQLETPAVKLMLARPSVARAPNAVPLPALLLGKPKSPSTVTPVPPLGLFQPAIPPIAPTAASAPKMSTLPTLLFPSFLSSPKELLIIH